MPIFCLESISTTFTISLSVTLNNTSYFLDIPTPISMKYKTKSKKNSVCKTGFGLNYFYKISHSVRWFDKPSLLLKWMIKTKCPCFAKTRTREGLKWVISCFLITIKQQFVFYCLSDVKLTADNMICLKSPEHLL